MLIADGEFRYDIRRAGELIAVENETLAWGIIRGTRRPASGSNRDETGTRGHQQTVMPPARQRSASVDLRAADGRRRRNRNRRRGNGVAPPRFARRRNFAGLERASQRIGGR